MTSLHFSFDDLVTAYRKAKVDAFYEREQALAHKFVEFEEDLEARLNALQGRLAARDWMEDPAILGDYTFVPKGLEPVDLDDPTKGQFTIFSSSRKNWNSLCAALAKKKKKPEATFRVMCNASVEWHVISALWILKEGHYFDAELGPSAYAARLRRLKPKDEELKGDFHHRALGSFAPYSPSYMAWRNNGLKATRAILDDGEESIAITADLRKFYHSVSPDFLLSERFQSMLPKEDNPQSGLLTADLVKSIKAWSQLAPTGSNEKKSFGLPIGLSASRIIANVMLLEFDEMITREICPDYYGRYVDDVFLVLRNRWGFKSSEEVWEMLCRRSNELLRKATENRETVYKLKLSYDSGASNLRFAGKKQKVFMLEGSSGKALLQTIEAHVKKNSSEWRHLPELDESDLETQPDFVAAGRDHAETPDNLRRSDGLTFRRLQLAFHLRDLEALADDLRPSQWSSERRKFFDLACDHLVALPHFFTYYPYLHRIISLGVAARDWKPVKRLIDQVVRTFRQIEETCTADLDHLGKCKEDLGLKFFLAAARALPVDATDTAAGYEGLSDFLTALANQLPSPRQDYSVPSTVGFAKGVFRADLARTPYRRRLLDSQGPLPDGRPSFFELLSCEFVQDLAEFWEEFFPDDGNLPPMALVFPTRPFSPAEVSAMAPSTKDPEALFRNMRRWMAAVRGIVFFSDDSSFVDQLQKWKSRHGGPDVWIPGAPFKDSIRVGLPCLEITEGSWTASVSGDPDPDRDRYLRTTKLINQILAGGERPHYIVLPELALKPQWFWRFATKLAANGISLISGIEYQRAPNGGAHEVINQVRASLVTDAPGYPTFLVVSQNKALAPKGEMMGLNQIAGKRLVKGSYDQKPVIRHGDMQFGILICSELTNLDFRARFRGKVDILLVPEWNKDTETFSSIVEATANDAHAFVVQSNNRRHGDSRVRAPYKKEAWKRDLVRLKGGINDYFAVGLIEYAKLRRFQSCEISPDEPFKPVPDGFSIDPARRALPQTNEPS
jgi:hypothetical protein